MKITEMNSCIEKMKKVYNFNDEITEIKVKRIGEIEELTIRTETPDGIFIELTTCAERLGSIPRI